MVVFIYKEIFMGGAETLIARMSKWFLSRDEKVILLTEGIYSGSKSSIDSLFHSIDVKFEVVPKITSLELEKIIVNQMNGQEEIKCFSFSLHFLLMAENIQKKLHNVKNTLYVIDPMSHTNNSLKIFYEKHIESKLYKKLYDNHNIIFMDPICGDEAEKCYNITLSNKEKRTFRLPMHLNTYNECLVKQCYRCDTFNILTIARADFPFKGYILGVIDNFANLKNKHPNITLTIISYGKDQEKIKKKIENLPQNIKNNICLIGPINYEDLKDYFNSANLFVGMGTTLLDAANYGVPGIIIHAFTYEAIATGFFYQYPHILGNSEHRKNIEPLIEQVIQMSEEEYAVLSKDSYMELKKMYDVEVVMPRLMGFIESQQKLDVGLYLPIVIFLNKIKGILNKFRS